MIGLFFFCILTCFYGYSFSAPAILQEATGWHVTSVGFLMAAMGMVGALAMLAGGASSDRTGERALHCIVPAWSWRLALCWRASTIQAGLWLDP